MMRSEFGYVQLVVTLANVFEYDMTVKDIYL